MSKVVYNLLSDRDLKKKLKEHGLSTRGTRQQLIKRHQEFVHMYNAQCDSLNPKSGKLESLGKLLPLQAICMHCFCSHGGIRLVSVSGENWSWKNLSCINLGLCNKRKCNENQKRVALLWKYPARMYICIEVLLILPGL